MGAHCSIHNDTVDETVMVFVGVNTKVLQPILWSMAGLATAISGGVAVGSVPALITVTLGSGEAILVSVSALTAAAGGLVSASNYVLDALQTQLVNDLTKGGYHKCLPGQTYTTPLVAPGLNLRAWLVRIQKTDTAIMIKRCDASVWSGHLYHVMDKRQFRHWKSHETIPLLHVVKGPTSTTGTLQEDGHASEEEEQDDEAEDFTLVESGMAQFQCKLVETTSTTNAQNGDSEDFDNSDNCAWVQVDAIATTTKNNE